jgi:phosphatidylglycerophosphate synthase
MPVLSSNTSKLIVQVTGRMFDATLRRWIDKPIALAGRKVALVGISADAVSVLGLAFGIASALAIAFGQFWIGLTLFLLSRLADGLDGAVARATTRTDRGGFLDIAFDFLVYAAIPLAFAIHNAHANALPAALLLASFLANGSAFLAFSIMAERRGLKTTRHGLKSIYYLAGIAEGFETIVFVVAFCLWSEWFPHLAIVFATMCFVSATGRLVLGWRMLT